MFSHCDNRHNANGTDPPSQDERITTRFNRATSRLERLVVVGHTGFVTLEATRWIRDVGVTLGVVSWVAGADLGPAGGELNKALFAALRNRKLLRSLAVSVAA